MEENDDGTRVSLLTAGRENEMHLQLFLADGFVVVHSCRQVALAFLGNGLHRNTNRRDERD